MCWEVNQGLQSLKFTTSYFFPDNLILKNDKIVNTFNHYFGSIVQNMNLYHWEDKPFSISKDFDIIKSITQNFHTRNCKDISYFSFQSISVDKVIKVVKNLKDSKAGAGDIPTKIPKESEFTFDIITACINKVFETRDFPDSLKMANVTPAFKKEDPLDKSNYRPVSILPLLSKVYERVI